MKSFFKLSRFFSLKSENKKKSRGSLTNIHFDCQPLSNSLNTIVVSCKDTTKHNPVSDSIEPKIDKWPDKQDKNYSS